MKKLIFVIIGLFLLSSLCIAQEIVTTKDGTKILLKDDYTWEYLKNYAGESSTPAPTPIIAKYAEEAIEIWNSSIDLGEVNYSDAVKLHLHYKNNTNKRVIGISVYVAIVNPFGKTVLEKTYEDEVTVEPLERQTNNTFWYFSDNPFINDEAYDRLWQMAQKGTAKITTKILKVIFEDGAVLKSKPVK
jgi:hypothetical protein